MIDSTRRRLAAFATLAALAIAAGPLSAQAPAGKLVLYTSQPERDASQTVAAFRQGESRRRRRGVPLGHDRGDGQARGRVLRRRSRRPTCSSSPMPPAWSAEERRPPAGLSARPRSHGFAPGTFDADKTYFGSKLITTGIAVNTRGEESAPRPGPISPSPSTRARSPCRARCIPAPRPSCSGTMTARPDLGWALLREAQGRPTRSPCAATARS